jgi:hypothetical protein
MSVTNQNNLPGDSTVQNDQIAFHNIPVPVIQVGMYAGQDEQVELTETSALEIEIEEATRAVITDGNGEVVFCRTRMQNDAVVTSETTLPAGLYRFVGTSFTQASATTSATSPTSGTDTTTTTPTA